MADCSQTLNPTPYSEWNEKPLFPEQTLPTVTHITRNQQGQRCAYGYDTDDNKCFHFYITFADAAEENSFITREWAHWRTSDPYTPHLLATDPPTDPPPGCGTPWTNPCGPPQVTETTTETRPGVGYGRDGANNPNR